MQAAAKILSKEAKETFVKKSSPVPDKKSAPSTADKKATTSAVTEKKTSAEKKTANEQSAKVKAEPIVEEAARRTPLRYGSKKGGESPRRIDGSGRLSTVNGAKFYDLLSKCFLSFPFRICSLFFLAHIYYQVCCLSNNFLIPTQILKDI